MSWHQTVFLYAVLFGSYFTVLFGMWPRPSTPQGARVWAPALGEGQHWAALPNLGVTPYLQSFTEGTTAIYRFGSTSHERAQNQATMLSKVSWQAPLLVLLSVIGFLVSFSISDMQFCNVLVSTFLFLHLSIGYGIDFLKKCLYWIWRNWEKSLRQQNLALHEVPLQRIIIHLLTDLSY